MVKITVLQAQYLLGYLGYGDGGADGAAGEKTREAVRTFQREFGGLAVDGIPGTETQAALRRAVAENWSRTGQEAASFWDTVPNFTRQEFRCPCGRCGGFPAEPEEALVRLLQQVRSHFGQAVTISSGVRCQAHNASLRGSVPNSRHLLGKAADFAVSGRSGAAVLAYVQQLEGVRYAYAIDDRFVHMDVN